MNLTGLTVNGRPVLVRTDDIHDKRGAARIIHALYTMKSVIRRRRLHWIIPIVVSLSLTACVTGLIVNDGLNIAEIIGAAVICAVISLILTHGITLSLTDDGMKEDIRALKFDADASPQCLQFVRDCMSADPGLWDLLHKIAPVEETDTPVAAT